MQLSIEGERMLKAGDYQGAIDFFEAALRVGTDDFEVRVHSREGDWYFSAGGGEGGLCCVCVCLSLAHPCTSSCRC